LLFFFSELDKNLTIVESNPIKLKIEIILIEDIRVVAMPIFSVETSLALITQKKKPNADITAVANIKIIEFKYRLLPVIVSILCLISPYM
jgi:hypothetical protein